MLNLVLHNPQYWLPEWLFSAVHVCGAGGVHVLLAAQCPAKCWGQTHGRGAFLL